MSDKPNIERLQAAAEAYAAENPELSGWDLRPRWMADLGGCQRKIVTLSIPEWL